MVGLFTIPMMVVLSRMSGGGLGAKYLDKWGYKEGKMPFSMTWVPELFFGMPFGFMAAQVYGVSLLWGLVIYWVMSGLAFKVMELGHFNAYHMGLEPENAQGTRKNSLFKPTEFIAKFFDIETGSRKWCWIFMGLKGALLGLCTLHPAGLLLAVLWPLGYQIGAEWKGKLPFGMVSTEVGEYLTGLYAGLVVVLVGAML